MTFVHQHQLLQAVLHFLLHHLPHAPPLLHLLSQVVSLSHSNNPVRVFLLSLCLLHAALVVRPHAHHLLPVVVLAVLHMQAAFLGMLLLLKIIVEISINIRKCFGNLIIK